MGSKAQCVLSHQVAALFLGGPDLWEFSVISVTVSQGQCMPQRPQKPLKMLHSSKGVLSAHAHFSSRSDDGSSCFCYLPMLSGEDSTGARG